MTGAQKAIIPGIILSCFLLILVNKLVNPANVAVAATEVVTSQVEPEKANNKAQPPDQCEYIDRYPEKVRGWCRLMENAAKQYAIDPLLIAAVMLVESGGQSEVMSHSGAVGLMQVMPRDGIASTFQCINGPCFANRPSISELVDPEFNVEYGVRMLAGLIEREGNSRDALKSYGPYDVGYDYADKVLQIYADL